MAKHADEQLSSLPDWLVNPRDKDKPLLLVDADEVLLQFVAGLEDHCNDCGLELRLTSFQITGNIFDRSTGDAIDAERVHGLIADFFEHRTGRLKPVADAADGLARISTQADVAILSNVPMAQREARITNLTSHGMAYPVIANAGGKGEMVARLAENRRHFVGFIDDLPPQHDSVASHAPQSYRIHSVADPRLRPLIPQAGAAHTRIDDWPALADHLLARITDHE